MLTPKIIRGTIRHFGQRYVEAASRGEPEGVLSISWMMAGGAVAGAFEGRSQAKAKAAREAGSLEDPRNVGLRLPLYGDVVEYDVFSLALGMLGFIPTDYMMELRAMGDGEMAYALGRLAKTRLAPEPDFVSLLPVAIEPESAILTDEDLDAFDGEALPDTLDTKS